MPASRLVPPPLPRPAILHNSRSIPSLNSGCARKERKLNSMWLAGKVYPHEIDIQETHAKHRKLDS